METFVVRVYPDDDPARAQVTGEPGAGAVESALESEAALRGVVSHVATGRSVSFHTADALVGFLVDPQGGEGIGEEPLTAI